MISSQVSAYFDHIITNYPYGIPKRLIHAKRNKQEIPIRFFGSKKGKVVFIQAQVIEGNPMLTPEGELLKAAITKGLQLDMEEISLIEIKLNNSEKDRIFSELKTKIEAIKPVCLVVMGEAIASFLFASSFSEVKGRWNTFDGMDAIATCGLQAVVKEPSLKKVFWNDLKFVLSRL